MRIFSSADIQGAVNNTNRTANRIVDTTSRLSSGSRVELARNDVASYAVGSRLKQEVAALAQAVSNAYQASSVLQVGDGAINRVTDILTRLKVLSVQAGSRNIGDSERALLDVEFQELTEEIDRIAGVTSFNAQKIIAGENVFTATNDFSEGQNGVINLTFRNFDNRPGSLGGDGDFTVSIEYSASANTNTAIITQTGQTNTTASASASNSQSATDVNTAAAATVTATAQVVSNTNSGAGGSTTFSASTDRFSSGSQSSDGAGGLSSFTSDRVSSRNTTLSNTTNPLTTSISNYLTPTQFSITIGVSQNSDTNNNLVFTKLVDSNDIPGLATGTPDFRGILLRFQNPTISGQLSSITSGEAEVLMVLDSTFALNPQPAQLTNPPTVAVPPATITYTDQFMIAQNDQGPVSDLNMRVGSGINPNEDQVELRFYGVTVENLGLTNSRIDTVIHADLSTQVIDQAIDFVVQNRSNIGGQTNRVTAAAQAVATAVLNQEAARSALMDLDVAAEIRDRANQQIQLQGGLSIIAQAQNLRRTVVRGLFGGVQTLGQLGL